MFKEIFNSHDCGGIADQMFIDLPMFYITVFIISITINATEIKKKKLSCIIFTSTCCICMCVSVIVNDYASWLFFCHSKEAALDLHFNTNEKLI